jgi:imidazolonepropionase
VDQARKILSAAKRLGFGIRMHVDQFRSDGGAQLAAELGAGSADHLEYTDTAGARLVHWSPASEPIL